MSKLTYNEITEDAFNSPSKNQLEEQIETWELVIKPSISTQIFNLHDLGVDILRANNIETLDIDFFREVIQYCDDNYINIPQLDDILSNELKVNLFGRWIYQFYVLDCFQILKYCISTGKVNSIQDLIQLDPLTIKDLFFEAIAFKIEMIGHVIKNEKGDELKLKWLFYTDLIDNDLTKFIENYLTPISLQYVVS